MPRPFTESERERIRSELKRRGLDLFQRQGIKKTSVEELARTAGISKGAFYSFFGSKEELFFLLLEEVEEEFHRRLWRFSEASGSARDRFAEMLREACTIWEEFPLLAHLQDPTVQSLLRKLPPEVVATHLKRDQIFFEEYLAHWNSGKEVLAITSTELAGLLRTLFYTFLHRSEYPAGEFESTLDFLITAAADTATPRDRSNG